MAVSLSDLISLPTKEQIIDKFVGILRLAGFPTASWQTTSFMRHTVEGESELYVDLATLIQQIGKGGFIKLAGEVGDSWVDLCAENVFNETRKAAIYTQGKATLTDAAGVGPVTINAGAFWIANEDKSLRYYNVAGGTLPLGGTLTLTFTAETAGAKWNEGNNALTQILTPQPGVTVNNPALDTGTWITQQGADAESNTALAQRCMDKWSLVGSGSDDGAYRYHVTSVSSEITRARIYSPGQGAVRVVVAGSAGPVSSTALAAAAALIESKRPLGVPDVVVLNATSNVQTLAGTLYIKVGYDPAAALSAVQSAVNSFGSGLALGSKVSREKIIGAIVGVTGVDDIELTSPASDVQLAASEVWVPSYSLTTQAV
jgi:uncharacterized phage protein gp47/JayE